MFLIHRKCSLCQKSPRNNARKGDFEKSPRETTRERVFWKKVSQKQRAKGCFGKKSPKNNARKGALEKSPPKTTRERVILKKVSQKQRAKGWFGKKSPRNNARKGISFLKPCRMCALEAFFYASPSSSPACLLFQSANSNINWCKPKAFILGW